jgi:FkbM family methyltransferase
MSVPGRAVRYGYRVVTRPLQLARMKLLGLRHFPPNYVYRPAFGDGSTVVDVGCGYDAEFSRHMIERYGVRALGIDPTRKHGESLKMLERNTAGRFRHVPLAVSRVRGLVTFHESRQNESGSILPTHSNVRNDAITTYDVESTDLTHLPERLGLARVDILKLDLEGAEYGLFDGLGKAELSPFQQIFLECHHHCTDHTIQETNALVESICRAGFEAFSSDKHNFLFYRR